MVAYGVGNGRAWGGGGGGERLAGGVPGGGLAAGGGGGGGPEAGVGAAADAVPLQQGGAAGLDEAQRGVGLDRGVLVRVGAAVRVGVPLGEPHRQRRVEAAHPGHDVGELLGGGERVGDVGVAVGVAGVQRDELG